MYRFIKNLIFVFFIVLIILSCNEGEKKNNSSTSIKDISESLFIEQDTSSEYYKPPFSIKNPDFVKSPYTGMTREEWIRCGVYILEGAFQYVDKLETPMFLPKFPGKSYPHEGNENAPPEIRSAAIFEAIARTFNVAAPILNERPDLTINGIKLIDYYKYHLLEALINPQCDYYIGRPERPFQPTCELGNISLWNLIAPDVFWNRLTKEEKDKVAETVNAWAISWTCTHNWRYFNVMMFTFLDYYGYNIDTTLMLAHFDNLQLHYAGDGWYRDHSYDYYTVHVFQLYNSVWLEKYGKNKAPGRAEIMKEHFKDFFKNYPMIFSREGHVNMYGRSILYRLGASAGMAAAFLSDMDSGIKPGVARRVASGALLQFGTHPAFFNQGIPSLGFYGPFDQCIQSYSCSASPYWMFLSFAALTFPADHPYWTATEEMGHWANIGKHEAYTKFLLGPGMLITNHGASGASEIRPGKVHGKDPNYSRLVYNTDFPWEAEPEDGIVSSALSVFIIDHDKRPQLPAHIDLAGYRDNVFYRQASYDYNVINLPTFIDMATIVIPGGEIRVERVRKIRKSKFYLGHFSLPHMGEEPKIINKEIDGKSCLIVAGKDRQLAMTNIMGWKYIGTREHTNLHPESRKSTLIYSEYEDVEYEYGSVDILISVLLHKTDSLSWGNDELQPVRNVEPLRKGVPLHLGGLKINLKNNQSYRVDFQDIDGMSTRQ